MTKPMTFLDAAWHSLSAMKRPMTVAEILAYARSVGVLESEGKTPSKTLNARLAVDILQHKAQSRFMRSDGSRFALREWQSEIQERIVPRRKLALFEEDILAFDAKYIRRYVEKKRNEEGG